MLKIEGHVVGGALTGGFHDNQNAATSGQQEPTSTIQGSNPCQFEFEQFVQCAQNQHDITYCKGFNEVLKQCKLEHGLM
ncbi:coiled-coil-helix-coiled-coil-helix domain-containing protein 2-like isoform X2 [Dendronephthya gigantea]|uniref:coiled-coil-helix-coiled-coil-helix domain-containing protein 2-like isoform X2 n=1 Tax=Dendronephthya gigantea TaxID=151771 RepID=UPI0010694CE7|nr:coiled-coil-helix-coiled-coil-helix domain-containing protein 2-like isoform X2 [Dendronephthya gigantea]